MGMAQPFVQTATFLDSIASSKLAAFDVDKDGDLDILLTGEKNGSAITYLYTNDGVGNFTAISTNLPAYSNAIIEVQDFNFDWRFQLGDSPEAKYSGFSDQKWRLLNLPHDWSIEGEYDRDHPTERGGGYLPAGIGWYRKSFKMDKEDEDKITTIEFDGIMANSDVWINGHHLGKRPNGYISLNYDLTPYLKYGKRKENVIAVRADNTVQPASGKILSGGVDSNALHKPKRFFGAARNIENGGSLSIIGTALTDTGSKMDEVIFEEFKGTGNMELQLDRRIANRRIFPAIDLISSSTRRDDLLLDDSTIKRMWVMRKYLTDMNPIEAMEFVSDRIKMTKNNDEFLISMNS